MDEHFNGLTPAETERLAILVEECAEVQAIACKVLRHGYSSFNPTLKDSRTNRGELSREIGHLMNAVKMMIEKDILEMDIQFHQDRKAETIAQWLHHQGE